MYKLSALKESQALTVVSYLVKLDKQQMALSCSVIKTELDEKGNYEYIFRSGTPINSYRLYLLKISTIQYFYEAVLVYIFVRKIWFL